MTLSHLAIVLGLGFALPQIYGLTNPAGFRDMLRKFPRSEPAGWVLMLVATGWFLWLLKAEAVSDFATYKPYMYIGFTLLGLGTCVFVKDFLAVRGLAIVLLLLAKLVTDTARWGESPWRLLLVTLAYLWIVAGIWLTVSPWRLRDIIEWKLATDQRVRIGSAVRLALWLLIAGLGFADVLK